ncbi:MAG TPA: ATP-binding protein [Nevskiaceae bacterium]|nr:ATP-binding protein [Nevskiaceae bacterium]
MRSLFWKLFGLQLLAAAVLIASALVVMRYYTAYNFTAFIEAQERERMSNVAGDVAHAYAREGDLGRAASQVLRARPGPPVDDYDRRPPPRDPEESDEPRPRHERGPPPLRVRDTEGNIVAGDRREPPPQGDMEVPIVAGGRTIGTLARPAIQGPPEVDEMRFHHQQLRGVVAVGACAMALAALISWLLTAIILRPIRKLSDGVAALARRDFAARLEVASGDEIGRLAQDFNRLAEALQRYDDRQRQWLADIAHELRTPLAVLRGELEAVLDGVRKLDRTNARSLHQEAVRLSGLVDDLHTLALADTGGLNIRRSSLAITPLVVETAARMKERFTARGFDLVVDARDLDLHVNGDAQRLDQVVTNLLDNTLRHADPPGPVRVIARRAGKLASIIVADAGPGVPKMALSRLFDRLYRTDVARTRVAGGSGLGLSICRSIVEAHGGSIEAGPSEQGGLSIEILLPLVT